MAALFMVTSGWKHPNDHQQHDEQIATLRNGIKSSRKANVICEIMDGSQECMELLLKKKPEHRLYKVKTAATF